MDYFKTKYLRKDIANMKYTIDLFNLLTKPSLLEFRIGDRAGKAGGGETLHI